MSPKVNALLLSLQSGDHRRDGRAFPLDQYPALVRNTLTRTKNSRNRIPEKCLDGKKIIYKSRNRNELFTYKRQLVSVIILANSVFVN